MGGSTQRLVTSAGLAGDALDACGWPMRAAGGGRALWHHAHGARLMRRGQEAQSRWVHGTVPRPAWQLHNPLGEDQLPWASHVATVVGLPRSRGRETDVKGDHAARNARWLTS